MGRRGELLYGMGIRALCLTYMHTSRIFGFIKGVQDKTPLILVVSVSFRVTREEIQNVATVVYPCCLKWYVSGAKKSWSQA